jgi:Zn-dependent M28 family amino/carboxypeptidase
MEFAFLTAEEAGLLGAREYVRRAVDEGGSGSSGS